MFEYELPLFDLILPIQHARTSKAHMRWMPDPKAKHTRKMVR